MCVLKLFGDLYLFRGSVLGSVFIYEVRFGFAFFVSPYRVEEVTEVGPRCLRRKLCSHQKKSSMQSGMDGEGRGRGGGGRDSLRNNQRSMNLDLLSRASRSYKQCLLLWKTQHIDTYTDFIGKCVIPCFPSGGTVGELNTCCRYIL